MLPEPTLHSIGFYCGRHGPGLLAEAQNSFSNVAFLLGAALAYVRWRRTAASDRFLLALVLLLGLVGVGSFVFHSHPTPSTLYVDLVPIQIYVLAVLAYLLRRVLACSWRQTGGLLVAFFLVRQAWMLAVPHGLGGGVTHLPTLLALLVLVVMLARRGLGLWKDLLAGASFYLVALLFRTWDLPLCPTWPWGLHWLWHGCTALAATWVLLGLIRGRTKIQMQP